MQIKCLLTVLLLLPTICWSQSITGPQHSGPPLNVTDGSTSCYPYSIAVSSGTLACSSGVATVTTGGGGSGSGNVGIGTVNFLSQYIGVSTLGPSNIVNVAGNIGIGSLAPQAKLVVNGNLGIGDGANTAGNLAVGFISDPKMGYYRVGTNELSFVINQNEVLNLIAQGLKLNTNGGVTTPDINFNGDGNTGLYHPGADNIGLTTNGVSRLVIDSAGNIGIGTTISQTALSVMSGNVGIGTWKPSAALVAIGNVGIGTWAATDATTTHAKLEVTGNGNTELLRVNDSGPNDTTPFIIQSDGNVGIGTSSPSTNLSVITTGTGTPLVAQSSCNGCNATPVSIVNNNAGGSSSSLAFGFSVANAGSGGITFARASGSTIATAAAFGLFVNDTNTTSYNRMLIDRAGNVGIGTGFVTFNSGTFTINTVPSNKLVVVGNVGIGTNASSGYVIGSSAPNGGMIVEGNVGIGSLSPGVALDVQGTVRATAFSGITSSQWATQNTTDVSLAGGNVGIGTTATTTSALTVINGNVGIGTWIPGSGLATGPTYKLHITSSDDNDTMVALEVAAATATSNPAWTAYRARGSMTSKAIVVSGDTVFQLNAFGYDGATYRAAARIDADVDATPGSSDMPGRMRFSTTADGAATVTERMRIDSAGNVGISTTVPGQVLDVAGGERIRGTNNLYFGDDNKASIVASATTTPDIKFLTNSAEIMRITNAGNVGIGTTIVQGALTVMSGNVGIGTWKPAAALEVKGTGDSYINSGNVGIGTTIPIKNLHVGGDVFLDRTTSTIWMREPDGTCGSCTLSNGEVFTCVSATCP